MINIKELAEANRHCRSKNCDGCPLYGKELCADREKFNAEVFVDFLDMLGIKEYKEIRIEQNSNKWRKA